MQLLIRDLTYSLGGLPLIEHADLNVEAGQRLALIGRNGAGKTTFLNLIAGELTPDSGEIVKSQGLKIASLSQEVPRDFSGSIYDIVTEGLGEDGKLLSQYHKASQALAAGDDRAAKELDRLQQELDRKNAWNLSQRVDTILTQMRLTESDSARSYGSDDASVISAGRKRWTLLAKALAAQPDVLLLDEPTNHLEISAIELLEERLAAFPGAIIFVTHDRAFLRRLATGIIELDRGALLKYPCSYDDYLVKRKEYLETQAKQVALFEKKLAQEEVWIRQGIMARRTRNEGRVRALKAMRVEAQKIRKLESVAKLNIQEASVSGRLVLQATDLSFSFHNDDGTTTTIADHLTCRAMRGDRLGVVGPNGTGKTTLIRLLLGELQPDSGSVRMGTELQIAYFDQLQEKLDFEKTVIDNVTDGAEHVYVNGQKKHVLGYLEDFLFTNARAKDKVKFLSGGERNRLLLARLFLKPCNVLVMDEPTNDLDAETLELLEEKLGDFAGTLIVVSHDREFLNNVVTGILAVEGNGFVHQYAGGYDDYVSQRVAPPWETAVKEEPKKSKPVQKPKPADSKPKLTYKEKLELEKIPEEVEKLESQIAQLDDQMSQPGFYQSASEEIASTTRQREDLQNKVDALYERWEELEAKL